MTAEQNKTQVKRKKTNVGELQLAGLHLVKYGHMIWSKLVTAGQREWTWTRMSSAPTKMPSRYCHFRCTTNQMSQHSPARDQQGHLSTRCTSHSPRGETGGRDRGAGGSRHKGGRGGRHREEGEATQTDSGQQAIQTEATQTESGQQRGRRHRPMVDSFFSHTLTSSKKGTTNLDAPIAWRWTGHSVMDRTLSHGQDTQSWHMPLSPGTCHR